MIKDFDKWNNNKKLVHYGKNNKQYHSRDIWWCSLGINIGDEHDGEGCDYQRPVLVLKGFSANTCLVIPLTSSTEKHPMRVPIGIVDGKEASAVLSQIRTIDTKRLLGRICYLNKEVFEVIRKAVKDML